MQKLLILLLVTTVTAGRAEHRTKGETIQCSIRTAAPSKATYRVVATVMTSKTGGAKLANGERNDANQRVFAALPSRSALGQTVTVHCPETGKTVKSVPICDVGPHSIADPYWKKGDRPLAAKGKSDKYGTAKNKAGIDLSLKLCHQLGLTYPYKGEVVWWFDSKQA